MPHLSWLQLSDLHVGMNDQDRLWPTVQKLLVDDLRRVVDEVNGFDIVFFTGDAVQRGTAGEYKRFEDVLATIWDAVAKPDTVLVAIPGNHDLERPGERNAQARGLLKDPEARDGLWSGEPESLKFVRERFAAFTEWWDRTPHRPRERYQPGLLPGDFSYVHRKPGLDIGILSLNSTWLQLFGSVKEGELYVDVRQVLPACEDDVEGWVQRQALNVLLTHQPRSWLAPEAQGHFDELIAPPGRFSAHLFGHMHEARVTSTRRGGGAVRWVCQSPSLFGLEKIGPTGGGQQIDRRHGYVAGQFILDGCAEVKLWPRRGVKVQDSAWRITSDFTFHLRDDLAHVAPEPISANLLAKSTRTAPVDAPPVDEADDWCSTVERSELWEWLRRDKGADGTVLNAVLEVIKTGQKSCAGIHQEPETDDPWTDLQFPRRVLERATDYLRSLRQSLTRERLVLLIVAPFIRTTVISSGLRRFQLVDPFDFSPRAQPDELRRRLEREHSDNTALVSRTTRFDKNYNRAVAWRLTHQAVRRWPGLWRSPAGLIDDEVQLAIGRLEQLLFPEHPGDRLMALARCTGGDPAIIARRDEPLRPINVSGNSFDPGELAGVLCVAGHAAMDPAVADAAFIEHLGVDPTADLEELLHAVRIAEWKRDPPRQVLHHECKSQVLDFTLRQYVTIANDVLEQVRSLSSSIGRALMVSAMPARFTPDGITPEMRSGVERYRLPHIRFRLDHNRIRILLMGRSLYGDPNLAVRELYQNALDGCRYRRARQDYAKRQGTYYGEEYSGAIVFRQGVENGRHFIECQDNGVGMSELILERVFSVAGQRFHDTTEFADERADWERLELPSRFVPNSQFGIGVLSYFMLADELEVSTRQFGRDGRLGMSLVARISSAAGLFRLENGPADMPAGTTVRLYLSEESRDARCREILRETLWVAEFVTTVADDEPEPMKWNPDIAGPVGSLRDTTLLEIVAGELWWSLGAVPILADGIATTLNLDLRLINLRGTRYPRLSVDRKQIVRWDSAWADTALRRDVAHLAAWEQLTIQLLLQLDDFDGEVARSVLDCLVQTNRHVQVGATDTTVPSGSLDVSRLGFSALDSTLAQRRRLAIPGTQHLLKWREDLLAREIGLSPRAPRAAAHVAGALPIIRTAPGDPHAIGVITDAAVHQGSTFVVSPFAAFLSAVVAGLTPEQARGRLTLYASHRLAPSITWPEVPTQVPVESEDDRRLVMSQLFDPYDPFVSRSGWPATISADQISRPGLKSVFKNAGPGSGRELEAVLRSRDLDGVGPFLMSSRWVSAIELTIAAERLQLPLSDVVAHARSMRPLGILVSPTTDAIDRPAGVHLRHLQNASMRLSYDQTGIAHLSAVYVPMVWSPAMPVLEEMEEFAAWLRASGVSVEGDLGTASAVAQGPLASYVSDDFLLGLLSMSVHHHTLSERARFVQSWLSTTNAPDQGDALKLFVESEVVPENMRAMMNNYLELGIAADDRRLFRAVPWTRESVATHDELQRVWFDWARFMLWNQPEDALLQRIQQLSTAICDPATTPEQRQDVPP